VEVRDGRHPDGSLFERIEFLERDAAGDAPAAG
jgi:hypothetical protein